MAASAGNLDSLLGMPVPIPDLSDVASVQSYTTSGSRSALNESIASATVDTTRPGFYGGLDHDLTATLTVLAVSDSANTITIGPAGADPAQITPFYVIGYSENALLLGFLTPFDTALSLDLGTDPNGSLVVLSTTQLAAGTTASFSASASFSGSSGPNPTPPPTPGLAVLDTTTGQPIAAAAQQCTGPVAGLQEQYLNISPDSLNISVSTANWFIHSGSGNDAIAVNSGMNVLDGGTGSNFLVGGSGSDTFFVDDRGATADIWSTVAGFHNGDAATIWGVTQQDFNLAWVDGQGATGFTGLTLHATASGRPTASLTLTGFTSADLTDGRLTVSFGTVGGSSYMYVLANH